MKKLLILVLLLSLAACNKMTRTDVIDHLVDNGFSRNQAYFYEKFYEDYIIRVGYLDRIEGYLQSLKYYYGPGPVAILDIGNSISFNYHFNEDAMLYSIMCLKGSTTYRTELMYKFSDDELIVGDDYCEFDSEKEEEYIEEFKRRKESILNIVTDLGLDKKKLQLLGNY